MLPSKECIRCGLDRPLTDYHKTYNSKNGLRPVCKTCRSEEAKLNYLKNYDHINTRTRAYAVQKKYGITMDEYEQLLSTASHCKVCSHDFSRIPKVLDHDHSSGNIRGVLCRNCNTGMGLFKDCPETLANAMRYLNEHGNYAHLHRGETKGCASPAFN